MLSIVLAPLPTLCLLALLAVATSAAVAPPAHGQGHQGEDDHHPDEVDHEGDHAHAAHPPHGSLGNVGAKLADPLSDLWSMQFNFQAPGFYDGDVNSGSPQVGGNLVVQPVMPLPMYGSGEDEWRLIMRPVIPIIFTQPIPEGPWAPGEFSFRGGLGDMALEMVLAPPASFTHLPKQLIFGVGAALGFPTSTNDDLGNQQFSAGPAVAVGWKNKLFTGVLFPSYFFGYADRSDRKSGTKDTSQLSFLYALTFNLPQAWQVGMNPTITYNDKAPSGDKWNVPIGLFAGRTIKIGQTPFNIKAGLEYSVVSQDTFGKRAIFRFQITPVIQSLIKKPIFGGG
jgi:hypothetical protein